MCARSPKCVHLHPGTYARRQLGSMFQPLPLVQLAQAPKQPCMDALVPCFSLHAYVRPPLPILFQKLPGTKRKKERKCSVLCDLLRFIDCDTTLTSHREFHVPVRHRDALLAAAARPDAVMHHLSMSPFFFSLVFFFYCSPIFFCRLPFLTHDNPPAPIRYCFSNIVRLRDHSPLTSPCLPTPAPMHATKKKTKCPSLRMNEWAAPVHNYFPALAWQLCL